MFGMILSGIPLGPEHENCEYGTSDFVVFLFEESWLGPWIFKILEH